MSHIGVLNSLRRFASGCASVDISISKSNKIYQNVEVVQGGTRVLGRLRGELLDFPLEGDDVLPRHRNRLAPAAAGRVPLSPKNEFT